MKRKSILRSILFVLFAIGTGVSFVKTKINPIKRTGSIEKKEKGIKVAAEKDTTDYINKKTCGKKEDTAGAKDIVREVVNTERSEPPAPDTDVVQPVGAASSKKEDSEENTNSAEQSTNYSTTEILVKFKPNEIENTEQSSRSFLETKSLSLTEYIESEEIAVVKVPENSTVEELINKLTKDANIEAVQPNYKYYPATISTNDTYKDLLWGLDNTGQTVHGSYGNGTGTADADIDAPEAWNIYEGGDTIVAIIDSGVAYDHPDLNVNMWDGSTCVDDNNNPLGGCIHGYDYEDNDLDPVPTINSHGTHIAGTIGAIKNNNQGIIGVSPNVEIMAIKTALYTDEIVKSIHFAENNSAKVINASWGGSGDDPFTEEAILNFSGLFIAAAHNYSRDNDLIPMYPCNYTLDNIICVAATDQNDDLASFSNYGETTVDIGAPGTNILSTILSELPVLYEDFQTVTPPAVPVNWTATSDWGTYDNSGDIVLYGDAFNMPYAQTADSTVTGPGIDLSGATGATFGFRTGCDTEYSMTQWTDYMTFEVSGDGISYTEIFRWDEAYIDYLNNDSSDEGIASYIFNDIEIPSSYVTSNFNFRFRWVANGNADTGDLGDGCQIDNLTISRYDVTSEGYDYYNGTSMATPHVVGAAALIWGYTPSLTTAEVKTAILDNGDSVASLSGKTVTGRRLNAAEALYGQFCENNSGYWLQDYNECGNISSGLCTANGGTFNPCASACRHKGPNVYCVLHCLEICTF